MSGTITMTGEEYDALRAEAEALRAENGHWKGMHASSMALRMSAEFDRDELRTELEAARGLLNSIADNTCDDRARDLAVDFLTATPAPEVRQLAREALSAENQRVVPPEPIIAPPHLFDKPSILKDCNVSYSNSSRPLVKQGERQEAVAWLHQVVCGDGEPDQALSFSPDNFPLAGTLGFRSIGHQPLYTTPQPSQDVRALVRAGQQMANSCYNLSQFEIIGDTDLKSQLRDLARGWDETLAAHRQAQRK